MEKYKMEMTELKAHLAIVSEVIRYKDIIYIDYPVHSNGGDMLIYQGALSFFSEYGFNIKKSYTCHNINIDEIRLLLRKGCSLVLHGGGNFGDIYEHHRAIRNEIFMSFPSENIILLPQTAHYISDAEVEKDSEIIRHLTDAFFFARDEFTLSLFRGFGVEAALCPDMAHTLFGKFPSKIKASKETLFFIRNDIEKIESKKYPDIAGFDWSDLQGRADWLLIRVVVNLQKRGVANNFTSFLWRRYVSWKISRYASFFSSYHNIVTSRLHGHIFSCLLSIDNVVLDNSYGKNSRYVSLWTKNIKGVSVTK